MRMCEFCWLLRSLQLKILLYHGTDIVDFELLENRQMKHP